MGQVTVDFVARDQPHGGWALVLVEQGPWLDSEVTMKLSQLQDRLYECLDAALGGDVVAQFPESAGLPLMIQVDAYDIPNDELPEFFDRFASGVLSVPANSEAMAKQKFYPSIQFKLERGTTMPSNKSLERTRDR